jgi:hypothetical protein
LILHQYLQAQQADVNGSAEAHGNVLRLQLLRAFRRFSFQPAAVFSYLGLSLLEMVRLRGELLVRRLFATNLEQVA